MISDHFDRRYQWFFTGVDDPALKQGYVDEQFFATEDELKQSYKRYGQRLGETMWRHLDQVPQVAEALKTLLDDPDCASSVELARARIGAELSKRQGDGAYIVPTPMLRYVLSLRKPIGSNIVNRVKREFERAAAEKVQVDVLVRPLSFLTRDGNVEGWLLHIGALKPERLVLLCKGAGELNNAVDDILKTWEVYRDMLAAELAAGETEPLTTAMMQLQLQSPAWSSKAGDVFLPMTGKPDPIRVINAIAAKLSVLDVEPNAEDYLDFFCTHVHGDGGGFYTVERAEALAVELAEGRGTDPAFIQSMFLHARDAGAGPELGVWAGRMKAGLVPSRHLPVESRVADFAHPITRIAPRSEGAWHFVASVLYRGEPFRAAFEVHRDGTVDMLKDWPLLNLALSVSAFGWYPHTMETANAR